MQYQEFIASKIKRVQPVGFDVPIQSLNMNTFDWQRCVLSWSLRVGRAALFLDTGLGKSLCQLEWGNQVYQHTGQNVLVLAPLAVAKQTLRESQKFSIACPVGVASEQCEVGAGITITNYEKLHRFDPASFGAVILDESSILKSLAGKTKKRVIESFQKTPYKLACTATPAPNDHMELGNHCEFLGVCTRAEMLAEYFVHDSSDTAKWRLRGHAKKQFWQWVASWAVLVQHPRDLGFECEGYDLPPLNIHSHVVESTEIPQGCLFPMEASTLQEHRQARRDSIEGRVEKLKEIVSGSPDQQWIVWTGLNDESKAASKAIDGVEVTGSMESEEKESAMLAFSNGEIKRLVTKSKICGFGMNWQQCNQVAFLGLDFSLESFYQSVRRCWRFGQQQPVDVHIITSDREGSTIDSINRKQADFDLMRQGMRDAMGDFTKEQLLSNERREVSKPQSECHQGETWTLHIGDVCHEIKHVPNDSIHYSIFSPPFSSLYTYSDYPQDMGNCSGDEEFFKHFRFLAEDLLRVLLPGRLVSVHCMQIPAMKQRDGFIGVRDFRGDIIRLFESIGFIFHSEVVIWKDPLIEATRTKAIGLMHKQVCKDSAMCKQGMPDYLVTFRKPGENPEPVSHPSGLTRWIGDPQQKPEIPPPTSIYSDETHDQTKNKYSHHIWRRYASPVWMDVNQTNVLKYSHARDNDDERHICPLQLDVISRGIELWSNPGDVVMSPFAGIGSEGHQAILMGRRFVGFELKPSYAKIALNNLEFACERSKAGELF